MPSQETTRYGSTAMFFHWLTAILVLAAFILGPEGKEIHIYSAAMDTQRRIHETLGISIFFITLIRLCWRWLDKHPALPPLPALIALGARLVQYLLYILLFLVPLSAITGAWLEGHALTFIGGLDVGPWINESHELGTKISRLHRLLGDTIIWVAGLHAAAGLFHHFIRKDGVLMSMLPQAINRLLSRKA